MPSRLHGKQIMNYQQRIILSNKHHISSALYHLERVLPDLKDGKIVGVQDLNTIREQLKLWEKNLHIELQDDII